LRSLAISASIGILVGFLLGRFVLLLPPAWAIAVAFVASLSVFAWAFRSLREVREHERKLEESISRLRDWR
jgi:membrane protein implicated in regulation of membrane protease activity